MAAEAEQLGGNCCSCAEKAPEKELLRVLEVRHFQKSHLSFSSTKTFTFNRFSSILRRRRRRRRREASTDTLVPPIFQQQQQQQLLTRTLRRSTIGRWRPRQNSLGGDDAHVLKHQSDVITAYFRVHVGSVLVFARNNCTRKRRR